MSKKDNHLSATEIKELHQPKEGEKGKGCIWSCTSSFEKGHQCSYRWHARERAESEDPHRYNYPAYQRLCVDGSFDPSPLAVVQHRARKKQPKRDDLRYPRRRPRPGQWDLTLGHNYSENAAKPFFFNAHHIIPRSVLHSEIAEAGKSDVRVATLIKQGLLIASYNHNHRPNMVNLPSDRIVALVLGLPRHLKGDEAEEYEIAPGESIRAADHPDYSKKVSFKIRPIINEYKAIVAEALKEDHPEPPNDLAVEKLANISKEIYASIMKAGPYMRGKSLDELRF